MQSGGQLRKSRRHRVIGSPGDRVMGRSTIPLQLLKDDGLVAVQQDAAFHVPTHGSGENYFFDIAPLLNQVLDRIAMVDADYILINDGPIVEYLCNVVGGGANEFYTTFECLVVGPGADECWQKRMVDID